MATKNSGIWAASQLLLAAERFTFEDGRADMAETRA